MRGLTIKVVGRLRSMAGALHVSQDDLVPFNVDTPGQWIDYFRKLIRLDRADGFLVITLPVQDNEFDRFLQVNPPLVLVNEAHPHMPHTVVDHVQRVYMAT
jgi:DNA-binding LacI/PurR family transcriptional regulator